MVLILSKKRDLSTNLVVDWLVSIGIETIRINDEDEINIISIDLNNNEIIVQVNESNICISPLTIDSFWYRRGFFNIRLERPIMENNINKLSKNIEFIRKRENELLHDYIFTILEKSFHIGNFRTGQNINKLHNLTVASDCGLFIPFTKIISKKAELLDFLKQHKKIVFKPYTEGGIDFVDENMYTDNGTVLFEKNDDFSKIEDYFPSSFCQNYIDKKIELRIFYFLGEFFSTAIFSQSNEKTKVDFRNYDDENPNRIIPFKLPKKIEVKLAKLMLQLNLKSGSIDMIYSLSKKFYFLEVNPVGQFQQVSYPCNYNLEHIIAHKLARK